MTALAAALAFALAHLAPDVLVEVLGTIFEPQRNHATPSPVIAGLFTTWLIGLVAPGVTYWFVATRLRRRY